MNIIKFFRSKENIIHNRFPELSYICESFPCFSDVIELSIDENFLNYKIFGSFLQKIVLMTREYPIIYNFLFKNIKHFSLEEINFKNKTGNTALILASLNSNTGSTIETVELLLKNNANVSIKNDIGWTAFMIACRYALISSSIETIKLLLEYKSNINERNYNGWSSLMISCRGCNTYSNPEIIYFLLENGAICNYFNNKKRLNALMILSKYNQNQYELVKLLSTKTDLKHKNIDDKLIIDICLPEYKKIFEKRNIFDILSEYIIKKSECMICCEEDIQGIVCEFDHFVCFKCIKNICKNSNDIMCVYCTRPL